MKLLRIKKHLLCIFMMLAMLLSNCGAGYTEEDSAGVNLTSPGAHQVYRPGDTVAIEGTAQELAEVAVAVRNEQDVLLFAAQPKVVSGVFATGFTLDPGAAEGQYSIFVGGSGLAEKKIYRFTVNSAGGTVVLLNKPSANAEYKAGDVVEIAGTAQGTGELAICVRNSKNGRVHVAQPSVVDGGFADRFALPDDAVGGKYTIALTGAGLEAAKTGQFTVTSAGGDPGGGGPNDPDEPEDPNAILFISGNGVAQKVSFSQADLEAMDQQRVLFSAASDIPSKLFVAAEGVPLQALLDRAGLSGAGVITFTGSDGYNISFTTEELLQTTRYSFPGQTEVRPIIALKRAEHSSNFGAMTETDAPVLCFGQRADTEQTLMGFVKRLKYITVSTGSPGQWDSPTAKITTPDSKQKAATQGGQIPAGSKIILECGSTPKMASIYYTTDGSAPTLNSNIYNVSGHNPELNIPITVNKDTTIKAMVVGRGKRDSQVVSLDFKVDGASQAQLPTEEIPQQAVDEKNIKKEEISLEDGRKGEKITVLEGALEDIEKGEQGSRLTIVSTADVDQVTAEVPAAVLQKAKEKGMLLGLDSVIGNYTLPLESLNLDEIAAGLGVKPEDLRLNIGISRAAGEVKKKLDSQVREGQRMLADPVEFSLEILAPNGKKVEYKSFGGTYAQREIPLAGDLNPRQSTGVVWREAQNSFCPVPTRFAARDGKNYAVILSRTNSLYTVLQSVRTFSDIRDSWAKEDIELLAAKLLISGKDETTYEPDSNITRAEFATLLVKALGLEEGVLKEGQFKDVDSAAWYAGSVAAATREKIIAGYEGNLFRPDNNITREEMAVMIARAALAAGKGETLSDSERDQLLSQFKDRQRISPWAAGDVALAARAGIIKGMPGGEFSPQTNADRAQSAAMLKQFLTFINFIAVDQPENSQAETGRPDNNQPE